MANGPSDATAEPVPGSANGATPAVEEAPIDGASLPNSEHRKSPDSPGGPSPVAASHPTAGEEDGGTNAGDKVVTLEEMAEDLKSIGDDGDRKFAEKFVRLLGKSGLSAKTARELLGGLSEIFQPEDPKVFFKKELEKLGADGKEVLGRVRMFRDAMRDGKEFSGEELIALEEVTQTAEGVRHVAKILEKAKSLDSGKFSNYRPTTAPTGREIGNADRIRMYEKAFALQRTNPEESRLEVTRLDKMFAR